MIARKSREIVRTISPSERPPTGGPAVQLGSDLKGHERPHSHTQDHQTITPNQFRTSARRAFHPMPPDYFRLVLYLITAGAASVARLFAELARTGKGELWEADDCDRGKPPRLTEVSPRAD